MNDSKDALLKYIIEHTNGAVAVHDRDLRYIYVSKRYLRDYGLPSFDIIGKHHYEVFPDLPQKWRDVHQRALSGEVCSSECDPYERADGTLEWTRWECRPWYEADNTVGGIIVYTEIITDRIDEELRIKQSEERFRSLFQNIPYIAVQGYDMTGKVLYWNAASEKLYGYSCNEAIGGNLLDLIIPHERREQVQRAIKHMDETGQVSPPAELILRRKDGSLVSVFSSHVILTNINNERELFCVDIDITDRKRAEDILLDAIRQTRTATETKNRFMANMSHELRTPMNGVLGMADLLYKTKLDGEQTRFLEILKHSGQRMMSIINEILDISRIESGRSELDIAPFSLFSLLDSVLAPLSLEAELKGVAFINNVAGDIPELLYGDAARIGQVVANIVGNAVKFTEKGSVKVDCKLFEKKRNTVRICIDVSDTGIGIAETSMPRLFEPFYQADDSVTRKYGGTGLGLAIAKQLVELMNGSLELKSMANEGTQCLLQLELKVAPDKKEQPDKGADVFAGQNLPHFRDVRVLVVEDDAVSAMVAENVLKKMGIEVLLAGNGREALDVLEMGNFIADLIFMDCQMPVMDGYEATRRIRRGTAGGSSQKIPIVAMTANAMRGDREKCINAGMNDYLSKPLDQVALGRMLKKWLPDKNSESMPVVCEPVAEAAPFMAVAGDRNIPVWDRDSVMKRVMGDEHLLSELVNLSLEYLPRQLEELARALEEGDGSVAVRCAHTIKGSCANIGAEKMRGLAFEIEKQCVAGKLTEARLVLPELKAGLSELREVLT